MEIHNVQELAQYIKNSRIQHVRPSLINTVKLCEVKLVLNDEKDCWSSMSYHELLQNTHREMVELQDALRKQKQEPSVKHTLEAALEAADVVNYLSMVIDNLLENPFQERGKHEAQDV